MGWSFSSMFSSDIGIDLGTANTLVYMKGRGIIINAPSIVALDKKDRKPLAFGVEAKEMMGRENPNIETVRPLRDGVIADFEVTEELLRYFIKKAQRNRPFVRPRIVIGVPSGVTEVEKRAVRESAERAGAREVYLIAEPMAAAIGINLPVGDAVGSMVIDIGGGTTEIAVIALSGIVTSRSLRVGGDDMDEAVVNHMKRKYSLLVGSRTAEQIKCTIGSAGPLDEEVQFPVKGLDLIASIPKTIIVDSTDIREAMNDPVNLIIEGVRQSLEQTPPELAADILDRGIILSGGGSLLRGMDRRLMEETSLPVIAAEEPLTCVVRGTGKVLEDIAFYQKMML